MTATDDDQTGSFELGSESLGLLLVDAEPLGNARDRGVPVHLVAGLLGEGLAEGAGTASGHGVLL